ncbi:MAG: tyrosine-type recombinase/integrase [Bacteroidetes bacterium]|nr:tyrosine-type recombinase/integrase [Bacteroidota bacterium]
MSGHNEYLFLNKYGRPYHKEGIKNSAKNAFASTFKTTKKNAQVEDFTFHDIRRTVKTRLVSKGVSSDHSDYILGHKYEGARKYYISISEQNIEDFRPSMEKLLFYNCDFLNDYLGITPTSKRSCESCKIEYDENSNFCSKCGNKLN